MHFTMVKGWVGVGFRVGIVEDGKCVNSNWQVNSSPEFMLFTSSSLKWCSKTWVRAWTKTASTHPKPIIQGCNHPSGITCKSILRHASYCRTPRGICKMLITSFSKGYKVHAYASVEYCIIENTLSFTHTVWLYLTNLLTDLVENITSMTN